jgi:hypothetical protein
MVMLLSVSASDRLPLSPPDFIFGARLNSISFAVLVDRFELDLLRSAWLLESPCDIGLFPGETKASDTVRLDALDTFETKPLEALACFVGLGGRNSDIVIGGPLVEVSEVPEPLGEDLESLDVLESFDLFDLGDVLDPVEARLFDSLLGFGGERTSVSSGNGSIVSRSARDLVRLKLNRLLVSEGLEDLESLFDWDAMLAP